MSDQLSEFEMALAEERRLFDLKLRANLNAHRSNFDDPVQDELNDSYDRAAERLRRSVEGS